jgi:hypothetical protein
MRLSVHASVRGSVHLSVRADARTLIRTGLADNDPLLHVYNRVAVAPAANEDDSEWEIMDGDASAAEAMPDAGLLPYH